MTTVAQGRPDLLESTAGVWWSPFANRNGVDVVHVDLALDGRREAQAFEWLDAIERVAWQKYVPTPRRRFALCRAALRSLLCDRLGCRNDELSFGALQHGKPYAIVRGTTTDAVSFNLSHSGEHGLIALARAGRLGVDIEEFAPQRNLHLINDAVMGPDELEELAALNGSRKLRHFYRLWTFKEALTKAIGTGLATDFSQFQVPTGLRAGDAFGTLTFPASAGVTWALEDIGDERFAAALAYKRSASSADETSVAAARTRDD